MPPGGPIKSVRPSESERARNGAASAPGQNSKCWKGMVGVAGFEPATPSSRTRCATRLRYTPTGGRSYNGVLPGPQARGISRGNAQVPHDGAAGDGDDEG